MNLVFPFIGSFLDGIGFGVFGVAGAGSEASPAFLPPSSNLNMHITLPLAQTGIGGFGFGALAIGGIVFVVFLLIMVWASRYTKVGPNHVLIISGRQHRYVGVDGQAAIRGFRIVKGGGTFIIPVIEKADVLSLELLTIDVQTPEVYTSKGVPVKVDGVAQIKVKGDDISIATASEQFLSKRVDDIKNIAMQTLEGHLRDVLDVVD